MRKALLALAFALLAGGITPSPAVADERDDYGLATLNVGDAVPFDKTLDDTAATAQPCAQHSAWDAFYIAGENALGMELWRLTMEAHKCWSAGGLTYFKVFTRGKTAALTPWTYDGIVGSINDGYPTLKGWAYRWREGKFHWCLTWYCPTVYPWLSVKAWPGTAASTWTWYSGVES